MDHEDTKAQREADALPEGWVWATIGEIAQDISSGFASGRHNQDNVGFPHLRPMNITAHGAISMAELKSVETTKYDRLREGDVLFNNTNSPALLGKTTYIRHDTNWAYSNHMTRIRFPANSVEPGWVAHYLHHLYYRGFYRLNARNHVNQSSINRTQLADIRLPIPPIAEQIRVVAKIEGLLSRLDAGVASLKRIRAALKRYRAAVLKAACEGRLVPQDPSDEPATTLLERILAERRAKWEEDLRAKGKDPKKAKYEEPAGPETEGLPELPEGWCWASAEQLCDFITKGTTPSADKLFSDAGDVPFIKVYNLTNAGWLDFSVKPTYVERQTHLKELSRSRVSPGDVLMNIVGPPLGKVSIVPSTHPEWNMNQAIAVFRPMPGFSNAFLSWCLLTESILDWAVQRAKATAGQFNLTLEICRNLPIPVPPRLEQERIVFELERRLSVMERMNNAVSSNIERSERLRQAILRRAFVGKLVAQ